MKASYICLGLLLLFACSACAVEDVYEDYEVEDYDVSRLDAALLAD